MPDLDEHVLTWFERELLDPRTISGRQLRHRRHFARLHPPDEFLFSCRLPHLRLRIGTKHPIRARYSEHCSIFISY